MSSTRVPPEHADVVVVGGGSAGAVLAARLSEHPDRTVVLMDRQAGPRPPARGGSTPGAGPAVRARPADFAAWVENGLTDWSYADVLPFFRDLENTPTGEDVYHGRSGPVPVRQRAEEESAPAQRGFVEAAVALGFKRVADFNGAEQRGVGGYPEIAVDGVPQDAATFYLTPEVRARPNLTVLDGVIVDRVLFGRNTATGVVTADGTVLRADEVVLSAGAYGSAAILLRSGVGPAEDLAVLGIDVVAALPVGQNLQDHPVFRDVYPLSREHPDGESVGGALLWTASPEAFRDELDLQVLAAVLPVAAAGAASGAFALSAALVQPESVGTLRLASRDPRRAPVVDGNLLGTVSDRHRLLAGVKLARELAAQSGLAHLLRRTPSPGITGLDDDELTRLIVAGSTAHGRPTSTAPMGDPADAWVVVDARGTVKGLEALRVVDASIVPGVPSCGTELTTIMLAERVARLVYAA
ncbi:GMC family oxidoreductase [Actinospica sp.]|uniref:GMC family oxidoreductase n=1 Tax=Actinospica sp. TaxID=1872142 RepID=UPI002C886B70|nr:FAD-dependent oxidoreductase [Actinospica sp.]HWG26672.1 FAD-dependent oxidoreductase [Actinospica sp.]